MKRGLILLLVLVICTSFAFASEGHDEYESIEKGEALINAEIPCDILTEEELEHVGEYFMEQMHPEEQHERMDERMGGHGSESLRQAHIRIAQMQYCDSANYTQNNERMMDGFISKMQWSPGWFLGNLFYVAVIAFVFGIVFWWTYKLIIPKKKRKK